MKTILKTSLAILALSVSAQAMDADPFAAPAPKPSRFAKFGAPVAVIVPATGPAKFTEAEFLAAPPASHHVVNKATHTVLPTASIAGDADNLAGAHTHFPRVAVQALVGAESRARGLAVTDLAKVTADLAKMTTQKDTWVQLVAELKGQKAAFTGTADLRELSAITSNANVIAAIDTLKAGSVATVKAEDDVADIDMSNSATILAALEGGTAKEKSRVFGALLAAHPRAANDGTDDIDVLVDMVHARLALA